MSANIISNKNLNQIVTKLFIWRRKLKISTIFITQSYFAVPKDVRLNSTHLLLWKFHIFYYESSTQTRASTNHI